MFLENVPDDGVETPQTPLVRVYRTLFVSARKKAKVGLGYRLGAARGGYAGRARRPHECCSAKERDRGLRAINA